MTYAQTARAFIDASRAGAGQTWMHSAADLDAITRGIPRHQADGYEPREKARAHAQHVNDTAAELRAALDAPRTPEPAKHAARVFDAARALLAAIGEGED